MILGDRAHITLNVSDLKSSLLFFKQLGFKTLDRHTESKDWALLTDEAILLLLNQAEEPFTGITYMSADMPQRALSLQQAGIEFDEMHGDEQDDLLQATFTAPGCIGISLVRFNPSGLPEPRLNKDTRCGVFGEFYLPVEDFEQSAQTWYELGYQALHTTDEPYPHGIFSDGHLIVGLHETGAEDQSALSYFAPDMPGRLKGLKLEGVDFVREFEDDHGEVRGAAAESPDGFRIYLFEGHFADA